MLRIGLIGEDPNDKDAVKNLLEQKYSDKVAFVGMLKNLRGHQLDNNRTAIALSIEYNSKLPAHVIFIRDTDGIITQNDKTQKVHDWFHDLNKKVNETGILLCNIYELEAMILADINTFNNIYKTKINFSGHVSYQKEPKELLIRKTRTMKKKYSENNCPELFSKLNFDVILSRCKYFEEFILEFEQKTNLKSTR